MVSRTNAVQPPTGPEFYLLMSTIKLRDRGEMQRRKDMAEHLDALKEIERRNEKAEAAKARKAKAAQKVPDEETDASEQERAETDASEQKRAEHTPS